jgi:nitrogen fixation NifU-like protein
MKHGHGSDPLMDHFVNPRNVGELSDADGVGDVGNPICGDIVRLFLKVKNDQIEKASFKTFGCRAAIATSSILTEMLRGKSIQDALKIKEKDMLAQLGNLPPLKRHCGKLAELALQAAVGDYYAKSRGDKKLSEDVARRVQDLREWSVVNENDEVGAPL